METDNLENLMLSKTPGYNKKSNSEKIYDITYVGFLIMLGIMAVMHFAFPLVAESGNSLSSADSANYNNELMREIFWTVIMFSLIDYFLIYDKVNNYFLAKLAGMILFGITTVTLSWLSAYFLGEDNVVFDAAPFVGGAALCQYLSYTIFNKPAYKLVYCRISKLAIIFIAVYINIAGDHSRNESHHKTPVKSSQLQPVI